MSQFKALLKIKHQVVQRCEITIANNQAKIVGKQKALQALIQEFYALNLPSEGGFGNFAQLNALKQNYRYEIDRLNHEIDLLQQKGLQLQAEYKESMIEHEKITYLDTLQTQKELARLKQLEQKQMDAISARAFYQKRNLHA
ncbi:flagellar FliJ family protein [Helicobacter cynogastricus]|uniref:flagellar FliJ family protein n=1 Tax=Helicobacter cynogastricus TaxID=329937 RepID=UPI000CF0DFE9|nr:flagellar FliJ family protein [Helicobacter cynogastricus]